MNITSKQWQLILGTVGAGVAFLLVQDPPLPYPWPLVLGLIAVIVAYLRPKGSDE